MIVRASVTATGITGGLVGIDRLYHDFQRVHRCVVLLWGRGEREQGVITPTEAGLPLSPLSASEL